MNAVTQILQSISEGDPHAASQLLPLVYGELRQLVLEGMPVSDLTQIKGLRLTELCVRGTRVTDLTPIKDMPLKRIRLDYRADREAFLTSLTGLEFINDKPAADFWKEVKGK